MSLEQVDRQRLTQLEEILEIHYDRLGEFQKQLALDADTSRRFQLKQQIKREILPEIRKFETEYGQIIARVAEAVWISDLEAESTLVPVQEAVQKIEKIPPEKYPKELPLLLTDIQEKLDEPEKTASAKLKVVIPIIPPLVSYELEMDTEASMVGVWQGIKSFFKQKLPVPKP